MPQQEPQSLEDIVITNAQAQGNPHISSALNRTIERLLREQIAQNAEDKRREKSASPGCHATCAPGKVLCGADEPDMISTTAPRSVTCRRCVTAMSQISLGQLNRAWHDGWEARDRQDRDSGD